MKQCNGNKKRFISFPYVRPLKRKCDINQMRIIRIIYSNTMFVYGFYDVAYAYWSKDNQYKNSFF